MSKFRKYWKESRKVVVSLTITAAVLPFVLWAVVSRQQLFTWAQAQQTDQLRIWFDPAEVIMKSGQSVKIDVIAEYSGGDRLVPALQSRIVGSPGLKVVPDEVDFSPGFSGRVKLATVEVTAAARGEQSLELPEEGVFTSLPDLTIITGKSKIWVK